MIFCHTCEEAHTDSEMVPYTEWNPDARRELMFLACPCGEKEDYGEAYKCDDCEEWFPDGDLETGSDLCGPCYLKEHGPW